MFTAKRRSKDQTIKKLRKARIWPSFMLLLIYLVFSFIGATITVSAVIYALADSKVALCFDSGKRAASLLEGKSDGEQTAVLEQLRASGSYEGIYIVSPSGDVGAGFGERTFTLEEEWPISFDSSIKTYSDSGTTEYIIKDGKLNNDLIKELFKKSYVVLNSINEIPGLKYDIKHSEYFWTAVPLGEDGSRLILKSRLDITSYDLFISIVCSMGTIIIMAVPILFLYISVISGILHQRQLTKLIYTDTVTGGNSWTYFEHYAKPALNRAMRVGKLCAIVDISWIKYRNFCNYHGTAEGEKLLEQVDIFLSKQLRRGEKCAHYGKSSFVLLLNCSSKEECEDRVKKMIFALPGTIDHESTVFHGGIYFSEPLPGEAKSLFKNSGVQPAELYRFAASARAAISDENHCTVAVFDKELLDAQIWEHKVEEKMHNALKNEEFKVYIQPKYNPVTEKLSGAEALVRWINEEDGFVPPGKFIPIFEKNGFITQLDDYMISHVAALQAKWLAEGKNIVPVSVNVSRAHFADKNLAEHIAGLVDVYKLPHHFIEIELTESAFFDDKSMLLSTVNSLKGMGFDISMDDFGAGYSSLNSLKDLPLDVLKLDAEFFRGENAGERGEIVVSEAIELAKKLNMRTVAEGVEKKDQVEFLAKNGCDMIQGYYYSKPVPAEEYEGKLS